MKLDDIKHGLSSLWDSVSDGWQHGCGANFQ
jgi:hypothetical protein